MLILEKLQNKDTQKKIKKAHISIIYLDITLLLDFPWDNNSDIPAEELFLTSLATYLEAVCSKWRAGERWTVTFSVSPPLTINKIM